MDKTEEKAAVIPAENAEKKPAENAETPAENAETKPMEKQNDPQKRRRRRIRALRSFLIRLILLAAVVYVLLFHIVGITTMPNQDMSPRLSAGDLILFYRIERNPKLQDVVIINKEGSGEKYVLRVVASPGDTVEVSEERGLAVNGNTQIESNIFYATRPYDTDIEYPIALKDNEYFVMADYRNGGKDSRFFGPVTREEIQGVVITILRRNGL